MMKKCFFNQLMFVLVFVTSSTHAITTETSYTGTWQLVTDASTLIDGDQLVIASNTEGKTAGSFQANSLTAEVSGFSDDYATITQLGENTLIFTLSVDNGYWTLTNTNNGKKLGTNKNQELVWDNLYTKWSISITDNNATISNAHNYGFICYNDTEDHFKTELLQKTAPVQLYRFVSDVPTHTVRITSSLKDACILPDALVVKEGHKCEISALPQPGYIFTGWTVTQGATDAAITEIYNPQTTILMGTEDIELTANFIQGEEYLLITDENFLQTGDIVLLANTYDHAVAEEIITSTFRLKTSTAYFTADHSRVTALTTYTPLILGGDLDAWTFAKDESNYLTVVANDKNDLKWTTTPTVYTLDVNYTDDPSTNHTAKIVGNNRLLYHNMTSDFFIAFETSRNLSVDFPRLYYKVTNAPRIVVDQRERKDLGYTLQNNKVVSVAKEISFTSYNLTNDMIISASQGFEVSLTENGTYMRTLSVPTSATSIWVRMQKGLAAGTYTGALTFEGGLQTRKVMLEGTVTPACVTHIINFDNNGITHLRNDILHDSKITPTPSLEYEDYTFIGWSETSTIEDNNTKPILFDFSQQIIQDINLYAVYLDSKTNKYTLQPTTSPILKDENCFSKESNITVAKNQTLTIAVPNVVSKQISLQPRATLKINEGASYTTEKIILQSEGDNVPQIILPTLNCQLTCTNLYFTKRITNDRYYFFSLPFECKVADIHLSDGTKAIFGEDFIIKEYNGETRVENQGTTSNWQPINTTKMLQAGKGYNIAVSTDTPTELFFPLTFPQGNTNLHEHQRAERTFDYTAYGENLESVDASHKGWNFIGVPSFSAYNPANWGTMYLTIPDVGTDQTYSQVLANATNIAALQPFSAFFYQATTDGILTFQANTSKKLVANKMPANTKQPIYIGVCLTNGCQQDETTLVIHEDYTQAYEIGADLEKMLGLVDKPQIYLHNNHYRYAFNAINQQDASQANKIGVYLPNQTETPYTLSLNKNHDTSHVQAVYLTDEISNITVNLMQKPHTFTSCYSHTDTRFTLKVIFTSNTTTQLTQTPYSWTVYQDAPLHVQIIGLSRNDRIQIMDQTGKIITNTTSRNGSYETNLPHTGIYCVSVIGQEGLHVKKLIIK